MKLRISSSLFFLSFTLVYALLCCFFYFKYVPFIDTFQIIFGPLLFLTLAITSINVEWGILFFVFVFPLINNLPYFFGIYGHIPHAPTALVLFLAFFLGWLLNRIFSSSKVKFDHPVFKPLILFSFLLIFSGIITFLRYANFFPFLSDKIYDIAVNVDHVSAGGAIMSDVFNLLNYLTGFVFFFVLFSTMKSKRFLKKVLIVLSVSVLISLLFSLIQKYYSPGLGNTPLWVNLNRMNSTFKDPNSFGVFLSAFIPVLLGMVLSFQKRIAKLFFLFIGLFALFIFPFIGSRSGFIGLIFAGIIFFLLIITKQKISLKKKIVYLTLFCLILSLIFVSFYIFFQHSNLFKRIEWSTEVVSKKDTFEDVFTKKLFFWDIALNMIKDYPVTGLGLGSYIIELPNYSKQMGFPYRITDSAENYYLQVSSEMGLVGFILILWLFIVVLKQMVKNIKKFPAQNSDRFILYGATAGIVSVLINFLVHSYIGSFEIKYFFWLLIAITITFSPETPKIGRGSVKFDSKFKISAAILVVLFSAIHLWNSTHSLSILKRNEEIGWDQDFGLYQLEKDDRGFFFRWAKKTAGIAEEDIGTSIVVPMRASHPDIQKTPVKVKIYSANRYFKREALVKEVVLRDTNWVEFKYSTSGLPKEKIHLVFETDRVWQPLKSLGVPDPRWLAIGLGKIWFEYPNKISEKKIKRVQKISNENWEGKFKEKLWGKGISRIKFATDERHVALLLNIRAYTAFDLGPYIILRIDDRIIGKSMINSDGWSSLVFMPDISAGEHLLSVEYLNDIYEPKLKQDRNVYLGDLEIIYLK